MPEPAHGPDWPALVAERVGHIRLDAGVAHAMLRELSEHVHDRYEELLATGRSPDEAMALALDEIGPGGTLGRKITHAREDMFTTTPFKRQILWPGVVALVLSGLATWFHFAVRQVFPGGHSYYIWPLRHNGVEYSAVVFFWPFLLAMPFVGAASAWLARRGGASTMQRLLVATSPALLNIVLFVLAAAVQTGRFVAKGYVAPLSLVFSGLALQSVSWVLAPALAGMLGALPFTFSEAPEHPPASTARA